MDANKELIEKFYQAFQKRDFDTMRNCYAEGIVYFDPLYSILSDEAVMMMWKQRYAGAESIQINFGDINTEDGEYYTSLYTVTYIFTQTGKPVNLSVKAYMRIIGDKITEHSDAFSVHKWAGMAYGLPGRLFGWNRLYQHTLKKNARKNLLEFIGQNC